MKVTLDNVTKPLKTWARERGINYGTVRARILRFGWPAEQALSESAYVPPLTGMRQLPSGSFQPRAVIGGRPYGLGGYPTEDQAQIVLDGVNAIRASSDVKEIGDERAVALITSKHKFAAQVREWLAAHGEVYAPKRGGRPSRRHLQPVKDETQDIVGNPA